MLDVLEEVKRSPGQDGQLAEKPLIMSISFSNTALGLFRPPYSGAGSDTDVLIIRGEYKQLLEALKTTSVRG